MWSTWTNKRGNLNLNNGRTLTRVPSLPCTSLILERFFRNENFGIICCLSRSATRTSKASLSLKVWSTLCLCNQERNSSKVVTDTGTHTGMGRSSSWPNLSESVIFLCMALMLIVGMLKRSIFVVIRLSHSKTINLAFCW